jgi:hypothetical protein
MCEFDPQEKSDIEALHWESYWTGIRIFLIAVNFQCPRNVPFTPFEFLSV